VDDRLYGHTSAAGKPYVHAGLKITEPQAEEILARDLVQYEKTVAESVKVPLNDNQFAALVSFTYDVGVPAFKRSTLLKRLSGRVGQVDKGGEKEIERTGQQAGS